MDTEMIKTLFLYTDWANMQVLENASRLSEEDYRRDFGLAWGSVHGTLGHLMWAEHIWWARWQDQPVDGAPDASSCPDLKAIRETWEPFMARRGTYIDTLREGDLTRKVAYKNSKGEAFSHPLWWLMLQVVNHGTDHRSHLSIMMTEMGFPPRQLDFIAFVRL